MTSREGKPPRLYSCLRLAKFIETATEPDWVAYLLWKAVESIDDTVLPLRPHHALERNERGRQIEAGQDGKRWYPKVENDKPGERESPESYDILNARSRC